MQELTRNPLKPAVSHGSEGGNEPVLGGAVGQGVMLRAPPAPRPWYGSPMEDPCPKTSLTPLDLGRVYNLDAPTRRWSGAGSRPHSRTGQHGGAGEGGRNQPAAAEIYGKEKVMKKINPWGFLITFLPLPPCHSLLSRRTGCAEAASSPVPSPNTFVRKLPVLDFWSGTTPRRRRH